MTPIEMEASDEVQVKVAIPEQAAVEMEASDTVTIQVVIEERETFEVG